MFTAVASPSQLPPSLLFGSKARWPPYQGQGGDGVWFYISQLHLDYGIQAKLVARSGLPIAG